MRSTTTRKQTNLKEIISKLLCVFTHFTKILTTLIYFNRSDLLILYSKRTVMNDNAAHLVD